MEQQRKAVPFNFKIKDYFMSLVFMWTKVSDSLLDILPGVSPIGGQGGGQAMALAICYWPPPPRGGQAKIFCYMSLSYLGKHV